MSVSQTIYAYTFLLFAHQSETARQMPLPVPAIPSLNREPKEEDFGEGKRAESAGSEQKAKVALNKLSFGNLGKLLLDYSCLLLHVSLVHVMDIIMDNNV